MSEGKIAEKLDWIDTIKGIGIILVVAGHTLWPSVQFFAYSFHMPLFFFISGFLFKEKDAIVMLRSKIKSLCIPYFIYLLAISLFEFKNVYYNRFHTPEQLHSIIYNMIYGGQLLTGSLGVFWFVSVLFISQQILNVIIKIKNTTAVYSIMIAMYLLSFIYPAFISSSPLDMMVCLQAMPLMYAGMRIRPMLSKIPLYLYLCLAALYFTIAFALPKQFFIDMKSSIFGFPVISLIGCLAVFVLLISIAKKLQSLYIFRRIGEASMTIMFAHQFINIYIARALFNNDIYIFIFCLLTSYMFHLLVSEFKLSRKLLLGA